MVSKNEQQAIDLFQGVFDYANNNFPKESKEDLSYFDEEEIAGKYFVFVRGFTILVKDKGQSLSEAKQQVINYLKTYFQRKETPEDIRLIEHSTMSYERLHWFYGIKEAVEAD